MIKDKIIITSTPKGGNSYYIEWINWQKRIRRTEKIKKLLDNSNE